MGFKSENEERREHENLRIREEQERILRQEAERMRRIEGQQRVGRGIRQPETPTNAPLTDEELADYKRFIGGPHVGTHTDANFTNDDKREVIKIGKILEMGAIPINHLPVHAPKEKDEEPWNSFVVPEKPTFRPEFIGTRTEKPLIAEEAGDAIKPATGFRIEEPGVMEFSASDTAFLRTIDMGVNSGMKVTVGPVTINPMVNLEGKPKTVGPEVDLTDEPVFLENRSRFSDILKRNILEATGDNNEAGEPLECAVEDAITKSIMEFVGSNLARLKSEIEDVMKWTPDTVTRTDWYQDVLDFHVKGCPDLVGTTPLIPDDAAKNRLRMDLIDEEIGELDIAIRNGDIVQTTDGIVDSIYMLIGMAITYGIDLRPCWNEVHRANMAKLKDGVIRRADGKILKPHGWEAPNLAPILEGQKPLT